MPFLLFGSFLVATALGLRSTARIGDDQGGYSGGGYSPPPYTPPQGYSHPPQNIGGQGYGQSAYYAQPVEEQHYYAPQSEVRLQSDNGGMFYANVEYGGRMMNMMVDTGAANCVFGDEIWNWLRRSVHSANGQSRLADNRVVANKQFMLPYLTACDRYGATATAHNVECNYIPGKGCGLLGQSFLRQCDVRQSGGIMTIRGR